MRSMTGFGQGAAQGERLRATVTLRGVNHRYLDLVLKLRDEVQDAEPLLRELFKERLLRGRVEATVEIESLGSRPVEVELNAELVGQLHALQEALTERGLTSGGLSFSDLVRLPEVVRFQAGGATWTDEDRDVLRDAATRALEQFVKARETEGAKLRETFLPRLDALGELVEALVARRGDVLVAIAENLRLRIAEILDGMNSEKLSEDRLAQEVAHLVDRSDVSEELDRLGSHLEHFRTIVGKDGSIGKRLDFIAQEIFRELNTLGAKCRDSEMIRHALDAKVICEQMREQVQNVE